MRLLLLLLSIVMYSGAYAQGCIQGVGHKHQQFVCFDGRSLNVEDGRYVWHARRGCFRSNVPCCTYRANHYGRYQHRATLEAALAECRYRYPFRLGEMQTH